MSARATLITGSRGSGKSHKARQLVRDVPRLIVFDPLHNTSLRASAVTYSMEDARRKLLRWYDRGFTIIFRPPEGREPEALSVLSDIVADVARAGRGRHTIMMMVEEMSLSFPSERVAADLRGFHKMVLTGRNFNIGVLGVAQRAALVSTVFTGNTDDVYVFRPAEEADFQRARATLGAAYEPQIRALRNFDYIYRDHTTARVSVFKYARK